MSAFRFSHTPIDTNALRAELADPACGGYAAFEGLVRDHNEGMNVRRLEYEAFEALAVKEGERIILEAIERFGVEHAACVHRIGDLAIGDMAVWVGVSSRHRHEAFLACRYIIDEVKHRVPIWKKEHYENGDSGWVNCERCAAAAPDAAAGQTQHHHGHEHHRAPQSAQHRHEHQHHPARRALAPDYSRQTALKEVGTAGQNKLRAGRVLVVGCGGLGVPVISYLAGAGVGRLGLVDSDRLEPSNLHRQTLYALSDVGQLKAELAAARVRALNPEVDAQVHTVRLDAGNAPAILSQYDLVIDCTDNFSTKFLLNDLCVQHKLPVIFSSVYQYEGQLQVVRPDRDGACLRCVWPEATRDGIVGNCSEAGVLGPVPGTFGSLQALEALKLLLDLPGQLTEELLVLDLLTLTTTRIRARRAQSCPDHTRARSTGSSATGAVSTSASADARESQTLELSFENLDQASAAGYEIIDVREPGEVATRPAPAARIRHIPLAQLLHGEPAPELRGRSLLVCLSGKRSLAAAQILRERGSSAVYSLRGGLERLARHQPA